MTLHLLCFLVHDSSSLQHHAVLPSPGDQTNGIPSVGPELPEVWARVNSLYLTSRLLSLSWRCGKGDEYSLAGFYCGSRFQTHRSSYFHPTHFSCSMFLLVAGCQQVQQVSCDFIEDRSNYKLLDNSWLLRFRSREAFRVLRKESNHLDKRNCSPYKWEGFTWRTVIDDHSGSLAWSPTVKYSWAIP